MADEPPFWKSVNKWNAQTAQSVFHASSEIDAAGFLEVFGRTGDLADFIPFVKDLWNHFIVENEIIITYIKIHLLQYIFAEGSVAGMVFR